MKNKNWNQEPQYDIKWIAIFILIMMVVSLFFSKDTKAGEVSYLDEEMYNYALANGYFSPAMKLENQYFFPAEDKITMDVTMINGTNGTYLCPSARECYVKSLEYEARGGHQYCVSLVMKRNGKVIWWRKYR